MLESEFRGRLVWKFKLPGWRDGSHFGSKRRGFDGVVDTIQTFYLFEFLLIFIPFLEKWQNF